jgi:sulfonate transport system substrate-binding protein
MRKAVIHPCVALFGAVVWSVVLSTASAAAEAQPIKELRLDYAYYSPPSLVLKHFGWVEAAFKADGIPVSWVLSAGSNRALEYLNSGSVDFGSTAGLAAVLSRANGNPVKAVYVFSRPEWVALVVPGNSAIRTVVDLKGRKVAATKGTDAYLFLLRSLHEVGLRKSDIEHVGLQHADGRIALEQGRVDAWVGLDPMMAASQLEGGSRLLYRNVNFNTYGFLNTSDAFAAEHPDYVKRVLESYEKARKWIIANPQETATILAAEAKISPQVAQLQLSRNDFGNPVPGPQHIAALKAAAPILLDEELVKPGTDVGRAIDDLIDPRYAKAVVR